MESGRKLIMYPMKSGRKLIMYPMEHVGKLITYLANPEKPAKLEKAGGPIVTIPEPRQSVGRKRSPADTIDTVPNSTKTLPGSENTEPLAKKLATYDLVIAGVYPGQLPEATEAFLSSLRQQMTAACAHER